MRRRRRCGRGLEQGDGAFLRLLRFSLGEKPHDGLHIRGLPQEDAGLRGLAFQLLPRPAAQNPVQSLPYGRFTRLGLQGFAQMPFRAVKPAALRLDPAQLEQHFGLSRHR
nr:hypothetical protein [Roseibacterium beibuensis]